MYDMSYESSHSQLQFGPKKCSKSKIHTLPNYEQTDLKTAIVQSRLEAKLAKIEEFFQNFILQSGMAINCFIIRLWPMQS